MHGLRAEELVAQIELLDAVPVVDRDLGDGVPLVIGRIVDQNRDRPQPLARRCDGGPGGFDVDEVAGEEQRAWALPASSAASAFPSSSRMSRKATRAALAAKARTISAPMPEAPPVTRTTRPARLG
jgi:hypothetical protein